MDRRTILLLGIAVGLMIISVIGLYFNRGSVISTDEAVITEYKIGSDIKIKELVVDSNKDITTLTKYVSKIKPLKKKEMVNLALAKEVEIKFNESISFYIQLSEKKYCYYTNKDKDISSLAKMPDGFYDWLVDKLKNETDITEYVNASINKLTNSEEFYNMSEDKRKKNCDSLLRKLKRRGKINSYSYSSTNKIYTFEYANGAKGGISIRVWNVE